jgi:hypothetical protein
LDRGCKVVSPQSEQAVSVLTFAVEAEARFIFIT